MKWLVKCHESFENVEGFAVFTNEEFVEWAGAIDRFAKVMDEKDEGYEWCVTEHGLTYIDTGKDLKNMFVIDPVPDETAALLKSLFLQNKFSNTFGTFMSVPYIEDYIKELEAY